MSVEDLLNEARNSSVVLVYSLSYAARHLSEDWLISKSWFFWVSIYVKRLVYSVLGVFYWSMSICSDCAVSGGFCLLTFSTSA